MDIKQTKNEIRCAGAGHAALHRDAELWDITGCRGDPAPCALGSVTGDDTEINFGLGRKRELTQRTEERIIRAIDWNRHVDVIQSALNRTRQPVRGFDYLPRVDRLDEMLRAKVAVGRQVRPSPEWDRTGAACAP
jgi:hypothetical protein